jgi:cellulose 1,4-beta-cellobiosidase
VHVIPVAASTIPTRTVLLPTMVLQKKKKKKERGESNNILIGPNGEVDSSTTFTVLTQFVTDDNTATGTLVAINRFYVQNGNVIPGYSLTTSYCSSAPYGGLASMGKKENGKKKKGQIIKILLGDAFSAGMVLVFSFWSAPGGGMWWLDEVYLSLLSFLPQIFSRHSQSPNGPCTSEPFVDGSLTLGNLRVGPLGSTTPTSATVATVATVTASVTTASATATTGVACRISLFLYLFFLLLIVVS